MDGQTLYDVFVMFLGVVAAGAFVGGVLSGNR